MSTLETQVTPPESATTPDLPDLDDVVKLAPVVVKETKAGFKTTEFWLSIVAAVVTATGAIPTPHDAKGYVVAGIVVAYAIARGLAKKGIPNTEVDPSVSV